MSFLSRLVRRGGGAIAKVTRGVSRIPGAKLLPGVALAASAVDIGSSVFGGGGGGGGGGLPALPSPSGMASFGSSRAVALPGSAGSSSLPGMRSIFRDDPNIIKALQPWAIPQYKLKTYHRAPLKGFVIRYDEKGDPYAIPKFLAVKYLGYKSAKKPPISVGDWEAVKKADRVTKKVKKMMTTMTRVDKAVRNGKVAVKGKAK